MKFNEPIFSEETFLEESKRFFLRIITQPLRVFTQYKGEGRQRRMVSVASN